MLDIRLIRENPDYVRERLATRDEGLARQVDALLEIDAERRRLETELQRLSSERNRLSKEIGVLRSRKESSTDLESKVRTIGDQISKLGEQVSAAEEAQKELLFGIPNLPHASVPIGADARSNPVIRTRGEHPVFSFKPL
jgi:seryl-tRNA synthetase